MKTNNIASYSDVLVTCMRQNPRWILLSEVRSAEAVMAVRNSISSGHNILSTIHADKAASIPSRLYSLLESNIDLEQFLRSIHRYVQIGVHIKGYYSKERQRFHREIAEVVEFYVTENNEPKTNTLYKKTPDGNVTVHNPTKYLLGYLESQGLIMQPDILVKEEFKTPSDEEQSGEQGQDTAAAGGAKQEVAETPAKEEVQQETTEPTPVESVPVNNPANEQQNNVQINNETPAPAAPAASAPAPSVAQPTQTSVQQQPTFVIPAASQAAQPVYNQQPQRVQPANNMANKTVYIRF